MRETIYYRLHSKNGLSSIWIYTSVYELLCIHEWHKCLSLFVCYNFRKVKYVLRCRVHRKIRDLLCMGENDATTSYNGLCSFSIFFISLVLDPNALIVAPFRAWLHSKCNAIRRESIFAAFTPFYCAINRVNRSKCALSKQATVDVEFSHANLMHFSIQHN